MTFVSMLLLALHLSFGSVTGLAAHYGHGGGVHVMDATGGGPSGG